MSQQQFPQQSIQQQRLKQQPPLIPLNDGNNLPVIGFGTYPLKGAAGVATLVSAIANGYRLIDSAYNYENEGTVGVAVRNAGVPREQLFITSKLPGRHHSYQAALTAIEESLYRAQLDYFDLYLIHWPNPQIGRYVEAWQALIEARSRGWLRSIGVSNFMPDHLDTLIEQTAVVPAVNQIELHPYFPQHSQRLYHQRHQIVTECWGPLARRTALLAEPVLQQLARSLNRTVSQLVLRWHVQQQLIALPKAAGAQHQQENISLFDFTLSAEAMTLIGGLAKADGRTETLHPLTHQEL